MNFSITVCFLIIAIPVEVVDIHHIHVLMQGMLEKEVFIARTSAHASTRQDAHFVILRRAISHARVKPVFHFSREQRKKQLDWLATDTDDITTQSHSLFACSREKKHAKWKTGLKWPGLSLFKPGKIFNATI